MIWLNAISLRRAALLFAIVALVVFSASCPGFFPSQGSIQSVSVSPVVVMLQVASTPKADTYTFSSTSVTVGGVSTVDTSTAAWSTGSNTVATAAAGGVVTEADTKGGDTTDVIASDSGTSCASTSTCATVYTYTGAPPTTFTLGYPTGLQPTQLVLGQVFSLTAVADINGSTTTNIAPFVLWAIESNTTGATISSNGTVSIPTTGTAGSFTVTATAYFGTAAVAAGGQASVTETLPFTVI